MPTQNCFFAMFDILGFKALRNRLGTEGLYNLYRRIIITDIEHAFMPKFQYVSSADRPTVAIPDPTSKRADCLLFSDTITFFTVNDSLDSFINIVFTALEMQKSSLVPPRAPLRGAIAWGDIVADGPIIVGSAIEAAYTGEQSQVWAGCMLTSEAESFCENNHYFTTFHRIFSTALDSEQDADKKKSILKASKAIVRYSVPLQDKDSAGTATYYTEEHYVLDWTHGVYVGAADKAFMEPINNHQKTIRDNTKKFETWARNR